VGLLFMIELCMSTHEGITHSSSHVIPLYKTGIIVLSVTVLGMHVIAPKYSYGFTSAYFWAE